MGEGGDAPAGRLYMWPWVGCSACQSRWVRPAGSRGLPVPVSLAGFHAGITGSRKVARYITASVKR